MYVWRQNDGRYRIDKFTTCRNPVILRIPADEFDRWFHTKDAAIEYMEMLKDKYS